MSQTLPLPPPGFESLTVEEQIDYVQSLWDHSAAQPEQVPVPTGIRKYCASDWRPTGANPDQAKSWEEFERNLTEELKRLKE